MSIAVTTRGLFAMKFETSCKFVALFKTPPWQSSTTPKTDDEPFTDT